MDPEFWYRAWQEEGSRTSFHRKDVHPYLRKHAGSELLQGKRIFVPLCGKTLDLIWFRAHASHVTGVELVEKAVLQFFSEQNLTPTRISSQSYEAERLTILNRDIFDLLPEEVGPIDLVYDRAALIAFPLEMRLRYVRQIDKLTPIGAKILLITLEYAPPSPGPPFSITPEEVEDYYGNGYDIVHIERQEVPNHRMSSKFGLHFLKEHAFLLTKVYV